MKKLIIGSSKNNKIGSYLLRWWMKTEYSHVYARWHLNQQERNIVYQASHGMVHYCSLSNFLTENFTVNEFELNLTDEQFKKLSSKCIDLAGQKYSITELVQIFLYDVTNGSIKFSDQKGYICSELMCELLEELGFKFNKPKYLITPKDIVESLKKA